MYFIYFKYRHAFYIDFELSINNFIYIYKNLKFFSHSLNLLLSATDILSIKLKKK